MVEKNRKLHNQFDAEASTSSQSGSGSEKSIFHGVSIFVDGFTVPSSQVLSLANNFPLRSALLLRNFINTNKVKSEIKLDNWTIYSNPSI